MKPPAALAPIVSVFGHRNYALFMGGMSPHLIGTWMQRVAVGWLAWELTHSPTWLGVIAAADLAPGMFMGPIAGAYTDRGIPLRLSKIAQVLAFAQAAALAALTALGWMTIEVLFLLAMFIGFVQPFAATARHAIVPATVPRAEFATAIAVDSALFNGSRFIGPALAGLVVPVAGVESAFAANALSCLVFIGALGMMDLPPPQRRSRKERRILGDIAESLSYVRGHVGVGPLFALLTVVSLTIRPLQDMLPGFADEVFAAGIVGLAWLTSSMGLGATVGAAWIALRGRLSGLTAVAMGGVLGLGLAVLGFVATGELAVAVIAGTLAGFALNIMSTGTQALVQSALTDDLRGRVMGLYTLIYRGLPAVGAVTVGVLAEAFGLRPTFAGAALLCLLAWLTAAGRRRAMTAALEAERA